MEGARRRKENWTKSEIDELRAAYLERHAILEGRLTYSLSSRDKELAWGEVVKRVNAQSQCARTLTEVKKKVSDVKSSVKKRERERRRLAHLTGGGPAPRLESWEEQMLDVIGDVAIGGFDGIDTFRCTNGIIDQRDNVCHNKPDEVIAKSLPFCNPMESHTQNATSSSGNGPCKTLGRGGDNGAEFDGPLSNTEADCEMAPAHTSTSRKKKRC